MRNAQHMFISQMVPKKCSFSVVIPAYNEENRLGKTLKALETVALRDNTLWRSVQVVIVCDGCRDETEKVARAWKTIDTMTVDVVAYGVNRGKGYALRRGMARTTGDVVAFLDADGSTSPAEFALLIPPILSGQCHVVAGSRRHGESVIPKKQPWKRRLLGGLFSLYTRTILSLPLYDTQCGCKLFRGDLGRKLFNLAREDGFAIDLEILYMAQLFGLTIAEKGVCWEHAEGSTVRPLRDGFKMLLAALRLRTHLSSFRQRQVIVTPAIHMGKS